MVLESSLYNNNRQNKSDFRVLLYSSIDNLNLSDYQQLNLVKDILAENKIDSNQILFDKYHKSYFRLIRKFYHLIQILIYLLPKYKIIHIFIPSDSQLIISLIIPFLLSRLFGLKIIVSYNDSKILTYRPIFRKIIISILKQCQEVTVNNFALKSEFEKLIKHVDLFYQPLNQSNIPFRSVDKITPKILVDFSGNPSQNLHGIIKAFRIIKQKYPRTELSILGNYNRIINSCNNINLENENGVFLSENNNEKEMLRLLNENDIYLNNSRDEFLPPSMMTALQSGIPVMAVENKSISTLISFGLSQFIHLFKDHIELADKLIDMVESSYPVASKAKTSNDKLSFCNFKNISNGWKKLYLSQGK